MARFGVGGTTKDAAGRAAAGVETGRSVSGLGYGLSVPDIRRTRRAAGRKFRRPSRKLRRTPGCAASDCRWNGRRFPARQSVDVHCAGDRVRRAVRASRAICCFSSSGSRRNVAGGSVLSCWNLIDADHDRLAAFHRLLIRVGGVLNFVLDETVLDGGQRAAHGVDALDVLLARRARFRRSAVRCRNCRPTGSAVLVTPVSCAMICCVRSARRAASSVGSPSASSLALVCSDCAPPSTAASACMRHAHHVDVGLLRGERRAGGLHVKAQHHRARIAGAEALAHDVRVQPPRGAELGDLFQKIVVRVEEEGKPRREGIHIQAGFDGRARCRRWRWPA